MITHQDKEFNEVTLQLDNVTLLNCIFNNCVLVYSGIGTTVIKGCSFNNVRWEMSGPAANTIGFMKSIYHGMGAGGKAIVEDTFNNIRKPFDKK